MEIILIIIKILCNYLLSSNDVLYSLLDIVYFEEP